MPQPTSALDPTDPRPAPGDSEGYAAATSPEQPVTKGLAIGDRRKGRRPLTPSAPSTSPSTRPSRRGFRSPGERLPETPPEVRQRFDDALEASRAGRMGEALRMLEALLDLDPTHVKAHSLMGGILVRSHRLAEAQAVCEGALVLDPLCLEAFLMLGLIAQVAGRDGEALKRFREVLQLDRTCWLAHFGLAELLAARGDRPGARQAYQAALRVLVAGPPRDRGHEYFPLAFRAEQYTARCLHRIAQLQDPG